MARDGADAKFCLDPEISLAHNRGYTAKLLEEIQAIIEAELQTLRDAWDAFFNP